MKIAVNALYLVAGKGGGVETYLRGLISALGRIDGSNEYLLFTNTDCEGSFDLPENFREIPCDVSALARPSKIAWEQAAFPSIITRHGAELLFSPGNIAPARHSMPSVAVIHDMVPFEIPASFTMLERTALKTLFYFTGKSSTRIITVSEYSKRDIVKRFRIAPERVTVVLNGVGEGFSKVDGPDIEGGYILALASDKAYKNIGRLLEAYRIVRDKHRITKKLVIAGNMGSAGLGAMEKAAKLDLAEHVAFKGFVASGDLPALYSGACAFVYPSYYEGFGLPVLESFACGTPVAASNAASIPEAVGGAGLLFDPYDPASIAGAISNIFADKALAAELVRKGFERAALLTWDKAATETVKVFEEVTSS